MPDKNLGYSFWLDGCSNHLDVNLSDTPSLAHFDPEELQTLVVEGGQLRPLKIRQHSVEGCHYQLCAGRLVLIDRLHRVVEAFTFGGELSIQAGDQSKHCRLVSPAPVIRLVTCSSPATLFAVETEVLLARRRAAHLKAQHLFEAHLLALDPFTLYLCCLKTLKAKFECFPQTGESESNACRFLQFLWVHIEALKSANAWPPEIPALEDIL